MSQFILPSRATDANSKSLSGATLNFYLAGTTTPTPVYSDATLTTPLPNPVVADSGGLFPAIYTDPEIRYRAFLKNSTGGHIVDYDPYVPADLSGSPLLGSTLGTLQSGSTNGLDVTRTFNGAPDGTTQFYGNVERIYAQGSNPIAFARNAYKGTHVQGSGVVAAADGTHQYVWGEANTTISNAFVMAAHIRLDAGADITSEGYYYRAVPLTLGAGATALAMKGYSCGDIGGTGVTNAYAFDAEDFTAASVSIGYRAQLNAGTNKYAFYSGGTAQSAFNGFVGIGMASAPQYQLQVIAPANNFTADLSNSHATSPVGLRIRYSASAPNNSTNEFITCSDNAFTRFSVTSSGSITMTGTININGSPVVGSRKTGTAANATDLATAITLVNDLKAKLVAHGLIS